MEGEDFAQISIRKYEMLQKIKRELHDSVCFSLWDGRYRYDKYQFYNETYAIKVIKEELDSYKKAYENIKTKRDTLEKQAKERIEELKAELEKEKQKKGFWSFLS